MSQETQVVAPSVDAKSILASFAPSDLAALRALLVAESAPSVVPVDLNLPTYKEIQDKAQELADLLPGIDLGEVDSAGKPVIYQWSVEQSARKEETLFDQRTGQKYTKLSGGNVNLRIGGKAKYNGSDVMLNMNITFSGSGKLA